MQRQLQAEHAAMRLVVGQCHLAAVRLDGRYRGMVRLAADDPSAYRLAQQRCPCRIRWQPHQCRRTHFLTRQEAVVVLLRLHERLHRSERIALAAVDRVEPVRVAALIQRAPQQAHVQQGCADFFALMLG